jgi:hypothetical protein
VVFTEPAGPVPVWTGNLTGCTGGGGGGGGVVAGGAEVSVGSGDPVAAGSALFEGISEWMVGDGGAEMEALLAVHADNNRAAVARSAVAVESLRTVVVDKRTPRGLRVRTSTR